jgi:hypothetical protein
MVETDRSQMTIKCCVEKMHFACWITKARIQTHIHNIQYLFLHNLLISSDLVKCFTATLAQTEKLHNDLSVITICLTKL